MGRTPYPYRMAKRAEPEAIQPNRLQRVLAFMFAAVIVLSLLAIILSIVRGAVGADPTTGLWPFILVLPMPGLAIAVLLLIALLVVTAVRRSRAARDARS